MRQLVSYQHVNLQKLAVTEVCPANYRQPKLVHTSVTLLPAIISILKAGIF